MYFCNYKCTPGKNYVLISIPVPYRFSVPLFFAKIILSVKFHLLHFTCTLFRSKRSDNERVRIRKTKKYQFFKRALILDDIDTRLCRENRMYL
ncbi:hypothetical protein PGB90_002135 [Kerria lacca]